MAVEIALKDLQKTIDEATTFLHTEVKRPSHIRFHINALCEDIALVQSCEILDPAVADDALGLRITAKNIKRKLDILLLDVPDSNSACSSSLATTCPEPVAKSIKLPPLKLPVFDGDPSKFAVFHSIFNENVLLNPDVSDTGKWVRLKESLTSVPAELISEIPETPGMLPVALKMLTDVYGGSDRTVTELYQKLHSLPPATRETASLRLTYSKMEGILLSLEHLQHKVNENQYVRSVFLGKFPAPVVHDVLKERDTPLSDLRSYLNRYILARESAAQQIVYSSPSSTRSPRQPPGTPRRPDPSRSSEASPGTFPRCLFCSENHWPDQCVTYVTAEERRKKASNRCVRCLRGQHPASPCARERRCVYCDSVDHNRAFCPKKFPSSSASTDKVLVVTETTQQRRKLTWQRRRGCFLTFLAPARSELPGGTQTVRVLLDTAGSRSLITRRAARQLGLKAVEPSCSFVGLNDDIVLDAPEADTTCKLETMDGDQVEVAAYIVDEIAKAVAIPNIRKFRHEFPQFNHLLIPPPGADKPVDILIGGDALVDVLLLDQGYMVDDEHQLLATRFGWLILSREKVAECSHGRENILLTAEDDYIKRMVDLETVGLTDIQKSDAEEEQQAIDKFYEKLNFVDNRYWLSWPWKEEQPNLQTNYGLALNRLRSLWRRLQKKPDLLQQYDGIIQQQVQDDVIQTVTPSDTAGKVTHYIPHHPVICPDKNTQTRIVYNASAKFQASDNSLNDCIWKGSKWVSDMTQTLMKFRLTQTAVVSDIAKAFHQIGINEEDRDALRFLWLKNPATPPTPENIQIYRFKRVAFGVVASPFLLDATIAHHLRQQPQTPIVIILQGNIYADNVVASLPSDVDPVAFYEETKAIFNSMSMNITKWATNDRKLEKYIPLEDRNLKRRQNVLGLKWNIDSDELSIKKSKLASDTSAVTKRNVLKRTAAVFDPLGWAAPVILQAKLFLRKLWASHTTWDTLIKQDLNEEWQQISICLNETAGIVLNRSYFLEQQPITEFSYEFHGFVDASANAYAVVVYVIRRTMQRTEGSLVAARSRLTPKRAVTIPKLELVAIRIGAKFIKYITETLQLPNTQTILWSDSKCALSWVKANKILPPVIQKQVNEIKKNDITEFRFVPSKQNRADIATRGATVSQLQEERWWDIPLWLHEKERWPQPATDERYPTEELLLVTDRRASIPPTVTPETQNGVLTLRINEFSSLHSLLRRTESILRAFKIFPKAVQLSATSAYATARILWLKWDQQRKYSPTTKSVGKILTFFDEDGLLRCNTRIQYATADAQSLFPIVLVKNSTLTKLIILHLHELNKHVGTSHTLALLRKQFYLPQARREIYNTITSHCYNCRRFIAKTYPTPPPGPLPPCRVQKTERPFQTVGVDIFGPMLVRLEKDKKVPKEKRWVLLCTCTVTRAVHLEVIINMTTDEILSAFRRFAARRGVPEQIICDNAPQFRTLNNKFQDLWKVFPNEEQSIKYFAPRETKWKYITQEAPWMGGHYERLIHTIKQAFERTYINLSLYYRQFEVAMLEIEAIINMRPVSYVDHDPESVVITPADFLQLKYPAIPIDTQIKPTDDVTTRLWKYTQHYIEQFWKKWSDYYLLALREREDQLQNRKPHSNYPPAPGDVVLMVDPNRKRSNWRLAIVERRIPSDDGQIRAVQLKLPNRVRMIRPIVKLAPMGLKIQLPNTRDDQLNVKEATIVVQAGEGSPSGLSDEEEVVEELGIDDVENMVDAESELAPPNEEAA